MLPIIIHGGLNFIYREFYPRNIEISQRHENSNLCKILFHYSNFISTTPMKFCFYKIFNNYPFIIWYIIQLICDLLFIYYVIYYMIYYSFIMWFIIWFIIHSLCDLLYDLLFIYYVIYYSFIMWFIIHLLYDLLFIYYMIYYSFIMWFIIQLSCDILFTYYMKVNAMEVSGIEGNYRLTCEKVKLSH